MEITECKTGDIVTLCLSGKLDTTNAKAFEEKFLTQIESGNRLFVIDLSELEGLTWPSSKG
jgi:anti-anti-sigma regulatory factor